MLISNGRISASRWIGWRLMFMSGLCRTLLINDRLVRQALVREEHIMTASISSGLLRFGENLAYAFGDEGRLLLLGRFGEVHAIGVDRFVA